MFVAETQKAPANWPGQIMSNFAGMDSYPGLSFAYPQNIPHALHNERPIENKEPLTLWNHFRMKFINGPKWFQNFRTYFTPGLNAAGISLNTLAVLGKAILPKATQSFLDKKAEWFSRYVIPVSFSWNALEAIVGHRVPEAISRILPGLAFLVLPFHNFNFATGISSTLGFLFEQVNERHGGKPPGNGDIWKNFSETMKSSVEIFKDIFRGNQTHENSFDQLGLMGMGLGTLGGLIFASQDRDTIAAKVFGILRNLGGLGSDIKFMTSPSKDPARARDLKIVGSVCGGASVLNILMRWTGSEEIARILNHLAIALDDFGLTYWASRSKKDNDQQLQSTLGDFSSSIIS